MKNWNERIIKISKDDNLEKEKKKKTESKEIKKVSYSTEIFATNKKKLGDFLCLVNFQFFALNL